MNASSENSTPRARRIGWLAFACLLAAFTAYVAHASQQLPDRVATHFGAAGHPNGWMTRAQYTKFTIGIGAGTPVFILAVFAVTERLKGWGLNIPNKAYWLEPERRQATYAFLQQQGLWLAAAMVVFHAVLFREIVAANSRSPVVLPTAHFLGVTGGFVAALGVWIVIVHRRFRRPSA